MSKNKAVLAFDTSNYTTSVAVVALNGETIADCRRLLSVKKGERGLRQSEALFRHVKNLPEIVSKAMQPVGERNIKICGIAVSSRPRPAEDSYMPCFLAGADLGRSMAAVLGVPCMEFSHQEGHIAAAAGVQPDSRRMLVFHMSGGTAEVLEVQGCKPSGIVGGTSDISYGQLLDRTGVALGMRFPCGAELDRIADRDRVKFHFSRSGRFVPDEPLLCDIKVRDGFVNLSGIETRILRKVGEIGDNGEITEPVRRLVSELFFRIGDSVLVMLKQCAEKTRVKDVVCAGGVAASSFLRDYLTEGQSLFGLDIRFGAPELSSDNAVGTGRLGVAALDSHYWSQYPP